MPGHSENISDPKGPQQGDLGGVHIIYHRTDIDVNEEFEGKDMSETVEPHSDAIEDVEMDNFASEGPFHPKCREQDNDFDDSANAFWSLYGKEAKTHDEAHFLSQAKDMDGLLIFAGLFSAVLASFLVGSTQNLQVNPAHESAYYQQQSVAMLAQVSEQVASIATLISNPSTSPLISVPSTPPPPYPKFHPSSSIVRVNAFWLASLVCSLSAALLAIAFQQWVRSYMRVFQRYDHPLKRARYRQFFFEGAKDMQNLAKAVPGMIRVALFLFLFGLVDSMLNTNTTVGATTIVLICVCGSFYMYNVSAHLWNVQPPYQTLISRPMSFVMQKFQLPYFGAPILRKQLTPWTIEANQEELVMEETKGRKERDIRAIRWLLDNTAANAEMEPLILAIPGTFSTEWGRDVWRKVASKSKSLESQTDSSPSGGQVSLTRHSPRFLEGGTNVDAVSRCVRYLFETCNNHSHFSNEDARRRRMRVCVEAVASLVCCADFRLDWFGDVGKLVSEIGHIDKINLSPTNTPDPSFIIRWTCLSLLAIQHHLNSNRLQVLAGYAVSGLTRFQSDLGQPDETAWRSARRIEECLKIGWECVGELHRAFEPYTVPQRSWTRRSHVQHILRNNEQQVSALEHLKVEADVMEDVDQRFSLYQDAMDDATHMLMRQLPGVSFDELRRSETFLLIGDTYTSSAASHAPVVPHLIFPGQQVKALASLGSKFREILLAEERDHVEYEGVLESLESIGRVPVPLRVPNGLMTRQLWRLQDLRDGGGLGYTVELFFLSMRPLLSIPSLHESNSVFYIGTFKLITSHWEKSRESQATQHLLLNLICDLIIRDRGVFSNFAYPEPITTMLLDVIGNILEGHAGPHSDVVREIESVNSTTCMDIGLQRRALARFGGTPEHLDHVLG